MKESKLEAALSYAAHGWCVLPLRPNAKMPDGDLAPHGVKDATTDAAIIRDWWTRNPNANLGVATGGAARLYVVDVDAPQGGHTKDGAASLAAEGIELPATLTATTPNGGRHYYFTNDRTLTKDQVKSCADVNGLLGVDVRASGGYIVAPPSEIDGKRYVFQGVGDFSAVRLATLPQAFYQQPKAAAANPAPSVVSARPLPMLGSADAVARARAYLATCDAAISGQGGHNATLHAAHAVVVGFALDDATALQLLESEYNPRCVPPWTQKELMHKIESARQNPQRPLGYLLTTGTTATGSSRTTGAESSSSADTSSAEESLTSRKSETLLIRDLNSFGDPLPENQNPNALFKGGWLRKGGGAMLIAPSGVGKSVINMQMFTSWGIGRDCFGIPPVYGSMDILAFQSEDDDTDMAEFRSGIGEGYRRMGWSDDDLRRAWGHIHYVDVTGKDGDSFLKRVREAQEKIHADLLAINPLFAFAGCNISDNTELTHFLRTGLDPILKNRDNPCGCFITNHTPKPSKDRKESPLDFSTLMYSGAGGGENTNWARAILVMRPRKAFGYYDLIAAKRGKRLGWRDSDDRITLVKTLAWSDDIIFWREPSADEVAEADARARAASGGGEGCAEVLDGVTPAQREKVVAACNARCGGWGTEKEFVDHLEEYRIFSPTKARAIIKRCVELGEIIKVKDAGNGNRTKLYTESQYADLVKPPCFNDNPAADAMTDSELDVEAICGGNVGT